MALIKKRSVILAKIEGTYGTDPTPEAADGVRVEGLEISNTVEFNDRDPVKGTLGMSPGIVGRNIGGITFQCELKGSGTAGTAPEYGPLLRSCALDQTIVVGTSVTYAPVSTATESCTIYAYQDGKLIKMTGCRGTYSLDLTVGQRPMITFTLTGKYVSDTDAALVTPTLDSTVPVSLKGNSFTWDSYAAVIQSLTIDAGNEVTVPDNINDASGYGDITITSRSMSGSFNPEQTLAAAYNWRTKLLASTQSALSIVIGSTAGNICTITAPKCVAKENTHGDRDGILTYDVPFNMGESTGDDEISIAFT